MEERAVFTIEEGLHQETEKLYSGAPDLRSLKDVAAEASQNQGSLSN